MVYKGSMVRFILIIALIFPLYVAADENITAASYLLVEADSFDIISGKDYHLKLPPASTTKVMTTIVAIENLNGDEMIVPNRKVIKFPRSKLYLIPGKKYTSIDLIKGAMIESANDAAYTLASYIGGTEENFAQMMNEKAKEIGARNTQFKNASGLFVDGQYTTCYDLALMFKYALSNDRFKEIVTMKYFLFHNSKKSVKYKNHNRFLFCFEPAIGGKTGFTRASKYCYVGAFEKDGKVYILSLLGSKNLWGDAVEILRELYEKLPSEKEIKLAKANSITLSSLKEKKDKKPVVKKKYKKSKKSKKKSADLNEV